MPSTLASTSAKGRPQPHPQHHRLKAVAAASGLWALLAAVALGGASLPAQAALSSTATVNGQVLIGGFNPSISDANGDGAAPTLVDTRTVTFGQFDSALGVLTGASGSLLVNSGNQLMAYRGLDGGKWNSTATVRATWQIPSSPVLNVGTTLAQAVSNRDTPVVYSSTWASLAWQASASGLDSLVGSGSLATQLSTSLSSLKEPQSSGSSAIASIATGSPNGLTGDVSLSYSYLQHANASFDSASDNDLFAMDMAVGDGGRGFELFALAGSQGAAQTTRLDLQGWQCSGDCAAFSLSLVDLQNAAAGSSSTGWVNAIGTGNAVYTFTLADDNAVGAAASRHSFDLVLSVSAVPEPGTWALWLAGLASVGGLVARRRPR